MTAKDLKNALLQEAVQGKLVPQIASEGNARDLLEEIRKEKAKLVKEGKIKKDTTKASASGRALPEITEDEIPFEIPENWCRCKLGDIVDKLTDGTHRTPKYVEKGIPFLSVKNLSSGKMDFENTKFITLEEHKELYARCNPEKGDMLLTKVGTTGIPVINDSDIEFSLFVSVALIKFNHDFLDAKFFLYLLQSPLVQEQAKENTRGVGNKNWVMDAIANTILVLPPHDEQKRIVVAIEKFMPLIEEYGKKETELKALNEQIGALTKKAILQEAVQGKLVPQISAEGNAKDLLEEIKKEKTKLIKEGKIKKEKTLPEISDDEIPFDIPENWCWCRLGELVDTNIGLTYSPSDIITEGGTEVLRSNNIQNGKIVYDNLVHVSRNVPEKCLSKKGDLLICARNGSKALVGKSALIEQDGMAFGAFMAIVRSPINPYILHFINSPVYRARLEGVNTTTINQITQDNLRETLFPLPPLNEQKRIITAIENLLPLCEKLGE